MYHNSKFFKLAIFYQALFTGITVFAASDEPTLEGGFAVLLRIFNAGLLLVGVALVAMVVLGAIKMAMSLGDPKGLQGATLTWTYAAIGAAIILGALLVYRIIAGVLNVRGASGASLFQNAADSIQEIMEHLIYKP